MEASWDFLHSGGNANIIQGIIRKIGARNFQTNDPNEAASKILFERLGIKGFFELDGKAWQPVPQWWFLEEQETS